MRGEMKMRERDMKIETERRDREKWERDIAS